MRSLLDGRPAIPPGIAAPKPHVELETHRAWAAERRQRALGEALLPSVRRVYTGEAAVGAAW